MARLLAFAALAALAGAAAVVPADEFTNAKVSRRIDATKHAVVSNTTVRLTGKGGSKYYLAFTEAEAAKLATVYAEEDAASGERFVVQRDDNVQQAGFVHYVVKLRKAVGEEGQTLRVVAVYTGLQQPLPAEVSQGESQLVVLPLNAHWTTPYATKTQTTIVRLASGRVEEYTRTPAPVSKDGAKVKYGPYADAEGYSVSSARIHGENNTPFAHADWVVREVEVSLWGNVAVEEHYELRHAGARLKHGFSRIDYSARGQAGASFSALTAVLPAGASDVYYRDVIGNISTSHVRSEAARTVLEIEPRFPLFGGWKTNWYQGYNVPAGSHVTTNGDGSLTLSIDAHIPYENVPIGDYKVRIVLPEAAGVVAVEAPFPHTVDTSARRFTFLDGPFHGRAIVDIKATGTVVSGVTYPGRITVTFTPRPFAVWYKAGYLVAAFAALFALLLVCSRIDLSLTPGSAAAAVAKDKKTQ